MRKIILAALAASLLSTLPSHAQQRPAGWQAWTWDGTCFAVVYATESSLPGGSSAERAYIAIKHVPKEKNFDGVAVVSGMNIPSGSEGLLEVNGEEFPLLIFGNAGFVRSGDPEKQLVEAMSKATEAKVVWTLKDRLETQTYRMDGFETAKKTIDTACPRPESAASAPKASEPSKPARKPRG